MVDSAFGKRVASVSGSDGGCPQIWLADDGATVVVQGYTQPRPAQAPDDESVVAIPLSLLLEAAQAVVQPGDPVSGLDLPVA
ncbi:MAG: hypothetical protein ACQSGP_26350 [Frankia sp.]